MPELHVIHYTDNQPLTPEEQFVIMHLHEEEINKKENSPSSNDIEVFTFRFMVEKSSSNNHQWYVYNLFT